jgi:DNA ligase-4
MQIHIDLSLPPQEQIKIFSKSKRDSTHDRSSAHPFVPSSDLGSFPCHFSLTSRLHSRAILSALSLSFSHAHLSHLYNQHLHRRLPTTRSPSRHIRQTIILEAEMVPYNERKSKIEEFWKITACAGDPRAVWSSNQPR